jgi:REP element-mobilizing transposase RayT
MPRGARLDIPGLLQHVIVRGIEKRDIFLDHRDRRLFLERLSKLLKDTETLCYAWSLIPNHFHLLLLPTKFKLAVLMRRLLTSYAVTFNLTHDRTGHLFQNRYKSIVCEKEAYLLELIRYIHLNPIRAGLVNNLRELDRYPWSGHAVLMGNRQMHGQVLEEVLQHFGNNIYLAREKYNQFIADGLTTGHRDDLVGGGLRRGKGIKNDSAERDHFDLRVLGSRTFLNNLLKNEVLHEKIDISLPLSELIDRISSLLNVESKAVRRPSKAPPLAEARGIICYFAVRELGYKGLELGKELHLSPAGVSIAVRRGEFLIRERPELKQKVLPTVRKIDKNVPL